MKSNSRLTKAEAIEYFLKRKPIIDEDHNKWYIIRLSHFIYEIVDEDCFEAGEYDGDDAIKKHEYMPD